MLTFKQWLIRQYGTTALNTPPKIITNSSNSTPVNTKSSNC
jgi:hypothetical protein